MLLPRDNISCWMLESGNNNALNRDKVSYVSQFIRPPLNNEIIHNIPFKKVWKIEADGWWLDMRFLSYKILLRQGDNEYSVLFCYDNNDNDDNAQNHRKRCFFSLKFDPSCAFLLIHFYVTISIKSKTPSFFLKIIVI